MSSGLDRTPDSIKEELRQAKDDLAIIHTRNYLEDGGEIDAADRQGRTRLHIAAENGYLKEVQLLLDRGASIDPRDTSGITPLHTASQNGHLEVVKLLLDRDADIDATDAHRGTPLLAATLGHSEVVALLLNRGADTSMKDNNSFTVMDHPSVSAQSKKIIEEHIKASRPIAESYAFFGRSDPASTSATAGPK